MNYVVIILILVNIIALYFLIKQKNKYKSNIKELINIKEQVNEAIENIQTNRIGYFENYVTYTEDDNSSEKYNYKIFVKELKKFKNGKSEIIIQKIEVYTNNNEIVRLIKEYLHSVTPSIVSEDSIIWLELEEDIKEKRKEKLNKIKDILNKSLL